MSTYRDERTEEERSLTLTEAERRLITDLLQWEWNDCDIRRREPRLQRRANDALQRQGGIEAILRKLGYL